MHSSKGEFVLVTGATGFLGSHVTRHLVSQGYNVAIVKRSSSNVTRIADILSEVASCDCDKCDLESIFEDHRIETVIHLATEYGHNETPRHRVFEANVDFPLRLLNAGTRHGVRCFINTDTYFNKFVGYTYLNDYCLSKRRFLDMGKRISKVHDIRFINVRLEHAFGEDDRESKFTTHVFKSLLKNVEQLELTFGKQKRDFIYVEDIVSVYSTILCKSSEVSRNSLTYELGYGSALSIRRFVEMVHQLSGSRTKLLFGALPYRENEIPCSKANIAPLLNLGWKPKYSLLEGVERVIRHYRNQDSWNDQSICAED